MRPISKEDRLRRGLEFQVVFQEGRRVERRAVLILWRRAAGPAQAGFTVSRQIRGAVCRNRARRRVREAYRASGRSLPAGTHAVLVARSVALVVPFGELCREIGEGIEIIAHRSGAAAGR